MFPRARRLSLTFVVLSSDSALCLGGGLVIYSLVIVNCSAVPAVVQPFVSISSICF